MTVSPTVSHAPADPESPVVLEAQAVSKHFEVRNTFGRGSTIHAVEDATLQLRRGQIVALVGESGSGKTTLARLLAHFYPVTSGQILLDGEAVDDGRGFGDRAFHSRVQLIFQDPFGALNPQKPVRHNLERALKLHHQFTDKAELEQRVLELMERVNLTPAADLVDAYPHQLSGGQRQRLVIARALAVDPEVLLADEPISMLDVSIRLDILNLLRTLRDEHDLAMLYITHDIASARYLANAVQVMYAGQTVEGGPTESVIQNPQHPYTQLLLESSPDPESSLDPGDALELGEPPNLADPPSGCRFHPRCPSAMDICRTTFPARSETSDGHWTHCWLHLERPDAEQKQAETQQT
ncbi:ABC transporter ATP-binding protein [Microlunatus soli]|uniref:Peptide/nickel transport system ATP-binding protein n=1 Tax=Microlunatus soli TaxID=630515 RepID=A0A1H1WDT1_9ACTN|nr:ABC transporter ATP-binding protein [Microlunatus soli]SDS94289.1 peptide/nickel transport system ATP-binding protein [Microlunatus soli]